MPHGKHRRRSRRTHIAPPGSAPGTLIVDPHANRTQIEITAFGPDKLEHETLTDARGVSDYLHRWPIVWVNVDGLGDLKTVERLGEIFGLHPLALEDVLNVYQRPKVEDYGDYQFIVVRMPSLNAHLETEQLSLFLGKNFILTFQDSLPGDCLNPVRQRLRNEQGRLRHEGPDLLMYSILDAVVDANFPLLEQYGEMLDDLEDRILGRPDQGTIAEIHRIKRDLLVLRRATWPLRDALHVLLRDPIPLISDDTRLYLRDCYDHTVRIIELIETYRELCADLVDLYLSSVNNRMNEVMKVLTVFATVFIPLTFISSIYGMNFNTAVSPWNLPELNWYFGYPLAMGLMAIVAAGLVFFFWRKGWLAPLNPKNFPSARHSIPLPPPPLPPASLPRDTASSPSPTAVQSGPPGSA
jgi:magnesium transporter